MANVKHMSTLALGIQAWNAWRADEPTVRGDLSGLDLVTNETLRDRLHSETREGVGIHDWNLQNVDLSGARLDGLVFYNADFQNSDLSNASICNCRFIRGVFGVSVPDIETLRDREGRLSEHTVKNLKAAACRLESTLAFGAEFKIASLSFADLTSMKVDEATRFSRVGVIGTKITQAKLEMLQDFGGLAPGRMSQMEIVDDVATLRRSFSGFLNSVHVVAILLFCAPYLWFLGKQWVLAGVGEGIAFPGRTSPILANLCRFIVSGGHDWRIWHVNPWACIVFILAICFNGARIALYVKTKQLEHHRVVTGFYNEFHLSGVWLKLLTSYRYLGIAALGMIILHTLIFLFKPVPL